VIFLLISEGGKNCFSSLSVADFEAQEILSSDSDLFLFLGDFLAEIF
jgi:hypothetical protein